MKKFIFIFVIFFIPIFSKYEKHYDEWDDYTIETACFTGNIYKSENYYKNDELIVCARSFGDYVDVALIRNYNISTAEIEIKFDDGAILTTNGFEKNDSGRALYMDSMQSFYVIENMKKKNFMYVKIKDTVYKINLAGFTKDFNKMKNSKDRLFNTGKSGLNYFLYSLDNDKRETFKLFDSFWIEFEAYSENDIFRRIEILYDLLYTINSLKDMNYTIDIKNKEYVRRIAEEYIHDDDKEIFEDYYDTVVDPKTSDMKGNL